MKQKNSIKFILGVKGTIPSINSIYKAKLVYNHGKPIPSLYKDSSAVKVVEHLIEQLKMINFKKDAPWIFNKDAIFDLHIQLIFKQSFFRRDTDNTIKLLQDTIFRYLGLNDSRVISIYATKSIFPNISEEKICVSLSESTSEIRFDKLEELPIPERIFLGGTCCETNWRDTLIPFLDNLGFSYFNPVVSDWTPECQEIENIEKNEKCDCHLYIITPEMKGVFSIAEIIDSAYSVRESSFGSMIFGILGEKNNWNPEQWKSLMAVLEMVKRISKGSKSIVGTIINKPEEILNYLGKPKKKKIESLK